LALLVLVQAGGEAVGVFVLQPNLGHVFAVEALEAAEVFQKLFLDVDLANLLEPFYLEKWIALDLKCFELGELSEDLDEVGKFLLSFELQIVS